MRRRAERADPLDLFDAVLQDADNRVVVAQALEPAGRLLVLRVLDRQEHHVDRTVDATRVGQHRAGHHDRLLVIGPDLDLIARGGVPTYRDRMPGGMQHSGDGRTDRAGTDECYRCAHRSQHTYGGWVAEPSLRRAIPSDAVSIAELAERAYEKYIARIGRRPAPMDTDYAALIGAANVWVLIDDNGLVGSLVTCVMDDHLLLDAIAVAPHAQGRGYGGALLLRRAEDDAARPASRRSGFTPMPR